MNYSVWPKHFPALLWFPAALFFVLPIPHTTALRGFLAFICLGLFIYIAYRDGRPSLPSLARAPLLIYFALVVWMIVAGLVLASHRTAVLHEIGSQWLRGLIYMGLGGMLTLLLQPAQRRVWVTTVCGVLIAHVLYADVQALIVSARDGEWARRMGGLTSGPDRLNLLQQFLLAFLVVEALRRFIGAGRYLPFSRGVLIGLWIIAALGFLFASVRNGLISLGVFIVLFLVLLHLSRRVPRRLTAGLMLLLVALLGVGAGISWRTDTRWQSLVETIPLALDTKASKAWLEWECYRPPQLASGEPVIHSNYVRLAWIKEGLLLVREHPLGMGFERGAFGRGLQAKYGQGLGQHSHSGLLDLTIGGGIPALGLWLAFLATVFVHGWRAWNTRRDVSGALLVFIVADYFIRSIVDSITRDYMLLQFLFLVGTLFTSMTTARDEPKHSHTKSA